MSTEDKNSGTQTQPSPESSGPCIAKVVSHLDTQYMGGLEVELLRTGSGNSERSGEVVPVKMISPFFGSTSRAFVGSDDDYNNTQKSYGMWFVPPDVGSLVVVIFINGTDGYWIGGVPDDNMNFMVPGIAATQHATTSTNNARLPVAEYNKQLHSTPSDPSQFKKPVHPIAARMSTQGLLGDDIRGITTSSARRETPSMVFGISTPGPLDKSTAAKRGAIGKTESKVPNAFVSRLGGTTFVMDDGDAAFLRKKPAGEAGPIYAAVEQNETDGNVGIPHNELVRIRTRTGHQILLHNSEDLIYIGNAKGTAWVELTSNGKIDIFAADSISVYSGNDINFTANKDINFNAVNGSINMSSHQNFYCTAGMNYEIKAGVDGKLSCGTNSNITAGGSHLETASEIHMNGPVASPAIAAFIPSRVPQHEPWKYHENLDPTMFTPDKTGAVIRPTDNSIPTPLVPAMFGKYTTVTDTFSKIKGSGT